MNGVRRFFAATSAAPPASQLPSTTETAVEPPLASPKPTSIQTLLPLSVSTGKQLYPPQSQPSSPAQLSSPPLSPGTATAGLFIRKDGPGSPRRKRVNTSDLVPPRPPSNPSPASFTSSLRPVRSRTPPVSSTSSSALNNGFRGPPPSRVAELSKQSYLDHDWKRTNSLVNTKDDLLMSLLASEAAVDSRGFEILSAEEVEELKREQQLLSSRVVAMRKKLALETKIRDAALNLQKLQTVKRLSKQTSEQVDAGNRKVDIATKELSKLLERANDVDRKLLEHRAGVLSLSVRNLETKLSGSIYVDSADDSTSVSASPILSQDPNSPTSSVTSISTRAKFDGAHLFAGHADTVIPHSTRKFFNPAQITVLEEKLKASEVAIEAAKANELQLQKEINLLRDEKSDIEATLNLDLQTAEETISKLEREMAEMEEAERGQRGWARERQLLEDELESQAIMIEQLQRRVEELETAGARSSGWEEALNAKDEEILRLRSATIQEREGWEREREQWNQVRSRIEQENQELEQMQEGLRKLEANAEQLATGRNAIHSLVREHGVSASFGDESIPGLVTSLRAHLVALNARLEQFELEKTEWNTLRRKHDEDVRNGLEARERLGREIEEARRDREDAWKEVRLLESRMKEQSTTVIELANVRASAPLPVSESKASEEHLRIMAALRGLWAMLPSVEARVSKMGKNSSLATPTPLGSPSLADLDVRALKALYDPKVGFTSPTLSGDFTVEEFVQRVQALIADDRALVERLIRFAQSHDLLRNNAERAQKLAQDSSKGLEMYQTQVKALEDRNSALNRKQLSLLDEVSSLQQSVDQMTQEKRDLEAQMTEQSTTIEDLTTANNKLSARALAFAEEAASAPNTVKLRLETQLAEVQKQLKETEDEIERIRSSESIQRVALLDELNSLQQENGDLRNQLRAKK
ncbi:hypothetical protein K439DRAFT_1650281 [Ramaria rubella]|nr:hypothetical protein K439DRAFT_1650281 [Ramaria rubella]